MKLQNLYETPSYDFYKIGRIVRDEHGADHSSQQDVIEVSYDKLVELFGEPDRHDEPDADVSFVWNLYVEYWEKDDFNPEDPEENQQTAEIEYWAKKYDGEMPNPRTIDQWRVNCETFAEKILAREIISKGIKADQSY